jgi:hypothetical protein
MTRKPTTLKTAQTHRHPNGTIHALSSDGGRTYTVTLSPEACTCPATVRCYHIRTAKVRYGATAAPADSFADDLLAFLTGTGAYAPKPATETDPEPPTPAAPRPIRCQAALYPCDCPACVPALAAVA